MWNLNLKQLKLPKIWTSKDEIYSIKMTRKPKPSKNWILIPNSDKKLLSASTFNNSATCKTCKANTAFNEPTNNNPLCHFNKQTVK